LKAKRIALKALPYIIAFMLSFLLFVIGIRLNDNLKSVFLNIAATFFGIPLIYLFYQTILNFSHKRLNKELYDYAKMQIDREILSVTYQLQKMVYKLEEKDLSQTGISKFLSLTKDNIIELLNRTEYLGFQIFKHWETAEKGLHEIIRDPYILNRLENEQIISLIEIMKDLRYIESIQKIDDLYIPMDRIVKSFKIASGPEISHKNINFPDRYLLFKKINGDKSVVMDFGDFHLYNVESLLIVFRINEKYLDIYCFAIFDLIKDINRWLDLTGKEFLIDTKQFRPAAPNHPG
jgi:hypothetical protein